MSLTMADRKWLGLPTVASAENKTVDKISYSKNYFTCAVLFSDNRIGFLSL